MKKRLSLLLTMITLTIVVTPVFAVKSNGAEFVDWNLSATVAPVPPYGTMDIPGSDIASKLIVNQPNGKTVAIITGAMNGLHASTVYTVYLSNGYTPISGWPGLFTTTIPPFSFVTDKNGAASWHLNLRDENFIGPGTHDLSIWINESGRTMLISDTFSVTVEKGFADADNDGLPDSSDPCPYDADNDVDGDGVCGDVDNCPVNVNSNQDDTDLDTIGDVCDICPLDPENDADNDGVCGGQDICPGFDDFSDADSDGLPDGCDSCPYDADNDVDGDGVCGDVDNCPVNVNPNQDDTDLDTIGDVCDICPLDPENDADNDGICSN